MTWTELLAREFAISIANGEVWVAIGLALELYAGCWAFGSWAAQTVGLLQPGAVGAVRPRYATPRGADTLRAWFRTLHPHADSPSESRDSCRRPRDPPV